MFLNFLISFKINLADGHKNSLLGWRNFDPVTKLEDLTVYCSSTYLQYLCMSLLKTWRRGSSTLSQRAKFSRRGFISGIRRSSALTKGLASRFKFSFSTSWSPWASAEKILLQAAMFVLRGGTAAARILYLFRISASTMFYTKKLSLFIYKDHVMPHVQIMEKPLIIYFWAG